MSKRKLIARIKVPDIVIVMLMVLFSCAFLILINYYTIRTLSASRAYVNGESQYSKGQKEASRHLVTYLYNNDPAEWELYLQDLQVPIGDMNARITLSNNAPDSICKKGFINGRNHPKDLDDMVWLFKNFKSVPFFSRAIVQWEKADAMIQELSEIGNEIHLKASTATLTAEEKEDIKNRLEKVIQQGTVSQDRFSEVLGEATREVKYYLIFANIFFTLLIIGSVSAYYFLMLKKLTASKKETENRNNDLTIVNTELDRFVYRASHDLRSPIASLRGLVDVIKLENNPDNISMYLDLMSQSLLKQDQFISDIIDYSRNNRIQVALEKFSLVQVVDEIIQHHRFLENASTIDIRVDLKLDMIQTDLVRLKIILNNLISNAIKYTNTIGDRWISIKSYKTDTFYTIEVADNGIGIERKNLGKIFEMFFVTDTNKGSGLGLYIAKEAAENINGNISVDSQINIGTKFSLTIPIENEA